MLPTVAEGVKGVRAGLDVQVERPVRIVGLNWDVETAPRLIS